MWHKVQVGLYLIPLSAIWVALVSSQRDRAARSVPTPPEVLKAEPSSGQSADVRVAVRERLRQKLQAMRDLTPPEAQTVPQRAEDDALGHPLADDREAAAAWQETLRLLRTISAEHDSRIDRGEVGPFTIAVTGDVAFPGSYSVLAGSMTARRAISGAGGATSPDATISLNRNDTEGNPIRFKASSKDADTPLRAGDVITVE